MTEALEVAASISTANASDVIILDEVGRGTSTRDGAALAAAVACKLGKAGCIAILSTHYTEVASPDGLLAAGISEHAQYGCMGYRSIAGDDEAPESIEFTYRLTPGPASKSMGIAVAGLAGVPPPVLSLATKIAQEKSSNFAASRATQSSSGLIKFVQRVLRATAAGDGCVLRALWHAAHEQPRGAYQERPQRAANCHA